MLVLSLLSDCQLGVVYMPKEKQGQQGQRDDSKRADDQRRMGQQQAEEMGRQNLIKGAATMIVLKGSARARTSSAEPT